MRESKPKSFWEARLKKAQDRLADLERKVAKFVESNGLLRRAADQKFRGAAKQRTMKTVRSQEMAVAMWKRQIKQLRTTKIPYYLERMQDIDTRTVWKRLRRPAL
jgi:outer membrane protein assembly factor BamD (BamD/ComL family)